MLFWGLALTVTVLRGAPKQIIAGDSIEFLVAIPGDLVGWTGSARLTGPSVMNGTVVIEGSDFHVTFLGQSATGTKQLVAGQYVLTVWATSGNDRYSVAQYPMTVTADLSLGTPAQSHAARMLSLVETAIANRLSGEKAIEAYSIDGVSVNKLSMEDLERLRTKYANEVARQQNGGAIGSVKVAFGPTTGEPLNTVRRYG